MNLRTKNFFLVITKGRINFHWSLPTGKGGHHCYFWFAYANRKHFKNIWAGVTPDERIKSHLEIKLWNRILINY